MSINKISPSKTNIYDKLLTIGKKYANLEDENFLKIGLFGYITESLAMIARDSAFHKSMLYNESFLNTAVIPKSIYNWAKMFNVDINRATPSYADIKISIPISAIETFSKKVSEYRKDYGEDTASLSDNIEVLILDKSNPILAGEYYFALEHSILVLPIEDGNGYSVKYILTEEKTTEIEKLNSPLLKTEIKNQNLIIKCRVFQYKVETFSKEISTSSFLNKKIHTFEFSDQFIGGRLFYILNDKTEEVELRYTNLGNKKTTEEKFAYYTLLDDNKLEISFSSGLDTFSPQPNSTLKMNIYSTRGSSVPSLFSGDAILSLSDEDLRAMPIVVNFDPQYIIGGSDIPSLKDIKQLIINEISTRDVIVTEADLNSYFEILTKLIESINNGNIKFIKKRDDILKRVFSTYILLRDGMDADGNYTEKDAYISRCVPTNTIDADFQITRNMSKQFGAIIKRKAGENSFEYKPTLLSNETDYYIVPFYMYVSLNPIKKVKYIYNLTDCEGTLEYKKIISSSSSKYITPNFVHLIRTSSNVNIENNYTFEFNFTTNFEINSTNLNQLVLNIYNGTNSSALLNSLTYESFSFGTDIISSKNDDETWSVTLNLKVDVNDEEFDFSEKNSELNYGTFICLKNSEGEVFLAPEDITVSLEVLCSIDGTENSINQIYQTKSPLSLFKNLDNLMFSDIDLNYSIYFKNEITEKFYSPSDILSLAKENNVINIKIDDDSTEIDKETLQESRIRNIVTSISVTIIENDIESTTKYLKEEILSYVNIKDIPVVHSSFFKNEISKTNFIKQLFAYITILKDNLNKLETNTFFDLKFYNTQGPSQLYNTLFTNLDMKMIIYLKENVNEAAYSLIKDYIRRLVDNCNLNEELKFSYISSEVLKAYGEGSSANYISDIQLIEMNGEYNPKITKIEKNDEYLYTPEWLNLDSEKLFLDAADEENSEDALIRFEFE